MSSLTGGDSVDYDEALSQLAVARPQGTHRSPRPTLRTAYSLLREHQTVSGDQLTTHAYRGSGYDEYATSAGTWRREILGRYLPRLPGVVCRGHYEFDPGAIRDVEPATDPEHPEEDEVRSRLSTLEYPGPRSRARYHRVAARELTDILKESGAAPREELADEAAVTKYSATNISQGEFSTPRDWWAIVGRSVLEALPWFETPVMPAGEYVYLGK